MERTEHEEKLQLIRQYLAQRDVVTRADLRFINAYLRGDGHESITT